MASGKEIRTQIGSIKNTQKITRAMEMIAASKLRKARERMEAARPYAAHAKKVILHLAKAHPEYRHPYLLPRFRIRTGTAVKAKRDETETADVRCGSRSAAGMRCPHSYKPIRRLHL